MYDVCMTVDASAPPTSPPTKEHGGGGDGGAYERITVNLIRKASDALASAVTLGDANRTDTINKALVVYELLLRTQTRPGGVIYVREGDGAELERLRLL